MAEAQELRVQPHDLVAEQSVLGAILINPEKLITVREFIEADDFTSIPIVSFLKQW